MEFKLVSSEVFKAYALNSIYNNFWQSVEMNEYRKAKGWEVYYPVVYDNDKIIGGAAICAYTTMKHKLFKANRGFLLDFSNEALLTFFHKHLIAFMKAQGGMQFTMDPYITYIERDKNGEAVPNGYNHQVIVDNLIKLGYKHHGFTTTINEELNEPRWMSILNLNLNEAQLMKNTSSLTRRCLKKSQHSGFSIVELQYDELYIYQDIIAKTSLRRGFSDRSLEYYQQMYNALVPSNMLKYLVMKLNVNEYIAELTSSLELEQNKLIAMRERANTSDVSDKLKNKLSAQESNVTSVHVKLDEAKLILSNHGSNVVIGGAMFITYANEVIYLTGGAYEEFLCFSSQYALQWHMIQYALSNNYPRYNFYGLSGDFTKTSEDYGVYEFKKGFNAIFEELIGEFDYDLDPKALNTYRLLKKVKSLIKH
ncbi:MAG: peptidoglycan bridge formation glycyltransferase FemA/FemB family protein [Erysipelotrichaceae bacterium]